MLWFGMRPALQQPTVARGIEAHDRLRQYILCVYVLEHFQA